MNRNYHRRNDDTIIDTILGILYNKKFLILILILFFAYIVFGLPYDQWDTNPSANNSAYTQGYDSKEATVTSISGNSATVEWTNILSQRSYSAKVDVSNYTFLKSGDKVEILENSPIIPITDVFSKSLGVEGSQVNAVIKYHYLSLFQRIVRAL